MYYNKEIGALGESIVETYLIKNEYTIVKKNFSCRFGEIDIIAKDNKKKELVFFEVKTRSSSTYGNPVEAVDTKKKKHIYKTAEYYVHCRKLEKEFIRIDVIEVYLKKDETYTINHIKQIF